MPVAAFHGLPEVESPLAIAEDDIGGARVRRMFTQGARLRRNGEYLTRQEVLSIPFDNRKALISSNYLEVFPQASTASVGDKHMVHIGRGQYDVFVGSKLNDEPLTKEEAENLINHP